MEKGTKDNNKICSYWCCGTRNGAIAWGAFFIVLGVYFLAQDLGYISHSVSIWPVLLFGFGVYIIVKNLGK